jgi:hypothetical protein
MSKAKPFCISKQEVWEAYKRVKANKGAAGVDEQSIADFEKRLRQNLYKIWNRMSSGSYFLPPVRTVKIPKANGGERKLGMPTVSDRIAQMVVKSRLEPEVDLLFHPDNAVKAIRAEIRSWNLPRRRDKSIEDLSRMFNPIVRGWVQYYGRYYRSALYPPMQQLDRALACWAYRKYKKLRGHLRRATHWIARMSRRDSRLFAHWQMGMRRGSMVGAV